jgi:hypothetical protein
MAEFQPFNLGQVFATAEGIKAARSQATTDRLREQYLGEQITGMREGRERQKQVDEITFGKERAGETYRKAQYVMQAPNPKNFVEQNFPEFIAEAQKHGVQWETVTDDSVKQMAQSVMAKAGAEAGIGPAAPEAFTLKPGEARYAGGRVVASQPAADNGFTLSPGQRRYGPNNEMLASAPDNEKPGGEFRTLTPAEIQNAGLPVGTSAQIGPDGKIDVLSKRDTSASLTQKDANTARLKLTTLRLAQQQLAKLKQTFAEGRQGFNAFGPGQGVLPTQAGKKFDAAIDQMRGTWTAIKRVPGVGAMSDYESKMDASQFPSRTDYESVIEQKIQGMEDQIALLSNGYEGLLSGNQQQQSAQPQQRQEAQPQPAQGIDEAGYASLPSGTQYRAPDGTIRVKR